MIAAFVTSTFDRFRPSRDPRHISCRFVLRAQPLNHILPQYFPLHCNAFHNFHCSLVNHNLSALFCLHLHVRKLISVHLSNNANIAVICQIVVDNSSARFEIFFLNRFILRKHTEQTLDHDALLSAVNSLIFVEDGDDLAKGRVLLAV